ncbi:MAG: Holliday junction resolvase RecU [Lachnospirales bacterium]
MGYWNTRGLRGSAFEEMINTTNEMYLKHNLGIIQKISTPITVTKIDNTKRLITEAYFSGESTVDYIGMVQGVGVCFDAKETANKSLPLQNVHSHQIDFMSNFMKQKGVAFLLVHFSVYKEIYFLPFEVLLKHHEEMKNGGRKSIPYNAFEKQYLVKNTKGFMVHYLEGLSQYLNNQI